MSPTFPNGKPIIWVVYSSSLQSLQDGGLQDSVQFPAKKRLNSMVHGRYLPTPAKQGGARQGIGGSDSTHQQQLRNKTSTTPFQQLFGNNFSTIDR